MENEKDGKNRRQEGRKRSSQLTDNEDDEDVNNIVTVAPASLTAALSSLSNQMEQMEGTMSQINSTLRNFHVDNCDKRIKTELPVCMLRFLNNLIQMDNEYLFNTLNRGVLTF